MAAVSTLAMVGLAVAAVGTAGSLYMQSQANSAAQDAAKAQRKAAGVQVAQNAAQAAAERRQQAREERIKRAQIMQAAENTGTASGSGEAGALGGMSTQLGVNVGFNQSMINFGKQQTQYGQMAADANTRANQYNSYGNLFSQAGSMGSGLFSSVGGWKALK